MSTGGPSGFQSDARWSRAWGMVLALFLGLGVVPGLADEKPAGALYLGRPGYLVIEAARDSTAGFRWEDGPRPGFRSLVWDQGRLTLPDSLEPENFARQDIGVPCTAQLAGSGASGQLVLLDGIYPVSEPVTLSDGRLELQVSAGELEFRGARIRYRRAVAENRTFKAGLLMLAGMTVLVVVLLRRARLKAAERAGT